MPKKVRFFLRRNSKVEISGKRPIIVPFHTATFVLLILMVAISILLFLRSDLFQIKVVKISSKIPECTTEENLKLATEAIGSSVIFYKNSLAEAKLLQKFYCVLQVKVTKKYPDTLYLEIFERIPVAAAVQISEDPNLAVATSSADISMLSATTSAIFAIDKNGILFKNISTASALPKVLVAQNLALSGKIQKKETLWLLNLLSRITNININFDKFVVTSEGFIIGVTKDNLLVELSADTNVEKTASSLQAIFKQAKIEGAKFTVLDLRFEKPVLR